jgi:hypothetical protein
MTTRRRTPFWLTDTPDNSKSFDLYNGSVNEIRQEAWAHYPKKWVAESAQSLLKATDMANTFGGVFGKYASLSFAACATVGAVGFLIAQSTDPSTAIATVGILAVGSGALKLTEVFSEKLDPYIRSAISSVRNEINTLDSNKSERENAISEISSSEKAHEREIKRDEMRKAFSECGRTSENIIEDRKKMEIALSLFTNDSDKRNTFAERNNPVNVNRFKDKYVTQEKDQRNDGLELIH